MVFWGLPPNSPLYLFFFTALFHDKILTMQIITVALHDLQLMIDRAADKVITAVAEQRNQSTQTKQDQLLTVQQAAEFLTLSVPTVYGLISKGAIPCMKRSKRVYFSKDELLNYLKQGKKKTVSELAAETDQYLSKKKEVRNA